jgi:hypothetical protein
LFQSLDHKAHLGQQEEMAKEANKVSRETLDPKEKEAYQAKMEKVRYLHLDSRQVGHHIQTAQPSL